jgi:hypothetical protein
LTLDECHQLKAAAAHLVDDWEPDPDYLWMFSNDADKARIRGRRMINSSDKILISVAQDAVDPQTGIV